MDDYQKSLEQCTTVGTAISIRNKLNAVRVSTEDENLRKLISSVLPDLEGMPPKTKIKIQPQSEPFKSLILYCIEMIKSKKPQWQILAEKNGWRPPAS